MPTKRQPLQRKLKPQITAAAVEAWRRAHAIGYPKPGWLDAERALARELGISWIVDMSPLDVTSAVAPDYIARNEALASDYARAWQLRCALLEAERAMSSKAEGAADREAAARNEQRPGSTATASDA